MHRFPSLALKSRIDAQIALVLTSLLHRFASLGLKSRIDAVLSCRRVEWPACAGVVATVPRPILIFVVSKKKGSPAAVVAATMPCQIQIFVVSKKNSPPAAVVAATVPRPILIIVALKKNGPPAALSWSLGRVACLQNDRCWRRQGQVATKAA